MPSNLYYMVLQRAIPFALRVAIPLLKALGRLLVSPLRLLPVTSEQFGPPRGYSLSTRQWIAQQEGEAAFQALYPVTNVSRSMPICTDPQPHWKFRSASSGAYPATFVAAIPGARVLCGNGDVITPDDLILSDVSRRFATAPRDHPALYRPKLPPCRHIEGSVGVLALQGQDNYYHWLFDVLPRLALIRRSGMQVDRFIVNHSFPFQKESLSLLRISSEQLLPGEAQRAHVKAERLIVPSFTGHAAPWVCSFLRETLKVSQKQSLRPQRLYVPRATGRRHITNDAELTAFLAERGFQAIDCGQLSLREQVEAFASAEAVIGPHGGALSNLVFCQPGTRVIEMFSPAYVNVCYWSLSETVGLEYAYLLGIGPMPREFVDPHILFDNITVDMDRLAALMDRLQLT